MFRISVPQDSPFYVSIAPLNQGPNTTVMKKDLAFHRKFLKSLDAALGYETNPRNLEAPWDTVYKQDLEARFRLSEDIIIETQQTIWSDMDPKQNLNPNVPLGTSITPSNRISKAVKPNVLATVLVSLNGSYVSLHPVLYELKKAITRRLTTRRGYPISPEAKHKIIELLRLAAHQVTGQGGLYLKSLRRVSIDVGCAVQVALVAAAGPWFSMRLLESSGSEAEEVLYDVFQEYEILQNMQVPDGDDDGGVVLPEGHALDMSDIYLGEGWTAVCHVESPQGQAILEGMADYVGDLVTQLKNWANGQVVG
ncbi:hypothetical protein K435DRAFT_968806 [Dendrothele bispora CBS 962.96]|uniref:Uncharacterized protein n=1 Tax=Dendrothele bispora (strain CBS 962.96) TaxID=1314807 RepID=A0A4V6T592_DENBC|nr:hypothetical protein K435DRAFT_968806 [Dendrothele bispora CBS 962.96]